MINSAEIRVGRLLEVRAEAGYRTNDDVDALFNAIFAATEKLPLSTRTVVVADWRFCPVMDSTAAERLLQRMTRNNPRTERSGALASRGSPAAVLQFLRLVRESKSPDRRLFFEKEPMIRWLSEVLSPAESARLREFLDERS